MARSLDVDEHEVSEEEIIEDLTDASQADLWLGVKSLGSTYFTARVLSNIVLPNKYLPTYNIVRSASTTAAFAVASADDIICIYFREGSEAYCD